MPWPPRPTDTLPAEDMVTAPVRMERALFERAEAVRKALGYASFAEYDIARLKTVLAIDEAALATRDAEARAA